jgi:hypothetical protein
MMIDGHVVARPQRNFSQGYYSSFQLREQIFRGRSRVAAKVAQTLELEFLHMSLRGGLRISAAAHHNHRKRDCFQPRSKMLEVS